MMKREKESRFDSAPVQGKVVAWLKLRYSGIELTRGEVSSGTRIDYPGKFKQDSLVMF